MMDLRIAAVENGFIVTEYAASPDQPKTFVFRDLDELFEHVKHHFGPPIEAWPAQEDADLKDAQSKIKGVGWACPESP